LGDFSPCLLLPATACYYLPATTPQAGAPAATAAAGFDVRALDCWVVHPDCCRHCRLSTCWGFLVEGFLVEGFLVEVFLVEGFLVEGFLVEGFLVEGFF
jgi:hypothetical protein